MTKQLLWSCSINFWDIPLTWLDIKLTCNLFLSLLQDHGYGWGMILFQKTILTLNTGSICVILTEMLKGSCEAGSLSRCMIFLRKVPCPIPKHLIAKLAQWFALVVLLIASSGWCPYFWVPKMQLICVKLALYVTIIYNSKWNMFCG